jgi:3-deoxy-D-manno-octulosonate cytidylyltransferase
MKRAPAHSPVFYAVIPARFASSRFPGKPLTLIAGKPMIERVYERVRHVHAFQEVLVATDDTRIARCVENFGGRAVMTAPELPSGTDRVAAALRGVEYDWVLNVQGDEPLVAPQLLNRLLQRAKSVRQPSIITAAHAMDAAQHGDPNQVKVVTTQAGRALYFSRAPIPDIGRAERVGPGALLKHIGLYLYHREALKAFIRQRPSLLENLEKLEQLRAFEAGIPIEVVLTDYRPINVDVPSDVAKVEACLRKG